MTDHSALLKEALLQLRALKARLAAAETAASEPIAIIGMGCRFPAEVWGPDDLWRRLIAGVDAVTEVPAERWPSERFFDPDPAAPGKLYTRAGAFLRSVDTFDAEAFGISPREAASVDPQHRLLLEVCWEALEHAALAPSALRGSATGVFVGLCADDYAQLSLTFEAADELDAYSGLGTSRAVAAGRVAYLLGLHGPAVQLDTSCSSSLVAVHLACQSLRTGDCELALAGGVHLLLSPLAAIARCKTTALSPDGRCRAFDASANGFVQGEGCGVVVLRRLAEARAAGDRVLAVIRGSAINHNGRSNGLGAPSQRAQARLVARALERAGVAASELGYLEAHGTGTALGDPIELSALAEALGTEPRAQPLWVGSAKSNFGHLEAAAGVLSLIKATLAVQHGAIPASLHVRELNPHLDWAKLPFAVARELVPWPGDRPRLAGVSSFGMSGTNAHVILAQATEEPAPPAALPARSWTLVPLSARTPEALAALATALAAHLRGAEAPALTDVGFTAALGRAHHGERAAIVAGERAEAASQLEALGRGELPAGATRGSAPGRAPVLAFLFSGQGSQHPAMGAELYQHEPAFRAAFDECAALVRAEHGASLTELWSDPRAAEHLGDTALAQPALFTFEYALARLWQSLGLVPELVLGHSLGEYVAALVAGVFELPEAVRLVVARARLMSALPRDGGMLAVLAPEAEVRSLLAAAAPELSIAALNGPALVVVAGDLGALSRLTAALRTRRIEARPLRVSHAFHSAKMEPMLDAFARIAETVRYRVPRLPLVSNVTGALAKEELASAAYWVRHVRQPVRFWDSVTSLGALSCSLALELGPTDTLTTIARAVPGPTTFLASLGRGSEHAQLARTAAELYVRGAPLDWSALYRDRPGQKTSLPTYPFQRKRHWSKAAEKTMTRLWSPPSPAVTAPPTQATTRPSPPVLDELRRLFAEALGAEPARLDPTRSLLEQGADSILLVAFARTLGEHYGLELTIRQLFEELSTLDALAAHLASARPAEAPARPAPAQVAEAFAPPPRSALASPAASPPPAQASPAASPPPAQARWSGPRRVQLSPPPAPAQPAQPVAPPAAPAPVPAPAAPASAHRTAAQWQPPPPRTLTAPQRQHLDQLIASFTRRTAASKQRRSDATAQCNNRRSSGGFRFETKELLYPIVATRSRGARLWDLDGNEYVDLAMGFGANFFGHGPPFLRAALDEQLSKGFQLGPEAELVAEVSARLCAATGMDRALYHCSGTEAVMTALRVARAAKRRPKIAMFGNSYHGHFDATLVIPDGRGVTSAPMSPGTPPSLTADTLVLPFAEPRALEAIEQHAHELAAVIVEPVQNRRPDLHPAAFLRELRALTRRLDIALIFDEILVGFRIHRGGAAAHFGIEPDLATYGKVVGGGLPLGVLAGRAALMDYVDGGPWRYGDQSYPRVEAAYSAGTFSKHPLALAAARAVLVEMEAGGPELHRGLNATTEAFAARVNARLAAHGAPIQLVHFGSFFRFSYQGNLSFVYQPLELELFFAHLVERGVYLWEGRTCFLSTAHTAAELDHVVGAVDDSARAMREGGFWAQPARRPAAQPSLP